MCAIRTYCEEVCQSRVAEGSGSVFAVHRSRAQLTVLESGERDVLGRGLHQRLGQRLVHQAHLGLDLVARGGSCSVSEIVQNGYDIHDIHCDCGACDFRGWVEFGGSTRDGDVMAKEDIKWLPWQTRTLVSR